MSYTHLVTLLANMRGRQVSVTTLDGQSYPNVTLVETGSEYVVLRRNVNTKQVGQRDELGVMRVTARRTRASEAEVLRGDYQVERIVVAMRALATVSQVLEPSNDADE